MHKQGFLCTFTWQSHQRHSWCSQFHLQRLPVGRDNVCHVWRVPLWWRLRGRCQQKRAPPTGIAWSPNTNEPHNRACHKGTLPWRHEFLLVFYKSRVICVHQLVSYVKDQEICLPLYRCMRQMDKDCKKMVSELIHRHAVWQTFFWIDPFFRGLWIQAPMVIGGVVSWLERIWIFIINLTSDL